MSRCIEGCLSRPSAPSPTQALHGNVPRMFSPARGLLLWTLLWCHTGWSQSLRTNLFQSGQGGYPRYRIPALTRTTQGSLLAVCEARTRTDSDWSHTDLLFRRSTDGGKTWSPASRIVPTPPNLTRNPVALAHRQGTAEERTLHNPVLISTRDGTVHLIFGAEYNRSFHSRSTNDGASFGPAQELTAACDTLRPRYDWKVVAPGPGHGLELSAGRPGKTNPLAGRLVVPIWLSPGTHGSGHHPSGIATLISDDHGSTWKAGDLIATDPDPIADPSEATLAELADGRVLLNVRNESPGLRRTITTSPDGATGWTPLKRSDSLFDPTCAASLIRVPGNPREAAATLVFTNPDNRPSSSPNAPNAAGSRDRRGLTLRLSADDGQTWPVHRVLDPGPSGYSDLAAGPDGSLWCLYENSPDSPLSYAALTLVRIDLDWIFGEDLRAGTNRFVPLFNGRNLDGWVNINCAPETWQATNGVIACTGQPIGELRTTRMYQNFILELEWRHLKPKGNAGVFVWADAITAKGQPFHRGVEVQVLDGLESEWYTSDGDVFPIHGARLTPLYGWGGDRAFPVTRRMHQSPEWNHYRITCIDGRLTHAVNGQVVTRGVQGSPRKGYICLESEGSPIEFRHLRIQELPAATALAPDDIAEPDVGFQSLYTGMDLRGWTAKPEVMHHWKANDWTLEHDGKTGGDSGTLWSDSEHGDFEMIVDWRYPDDGPGEGAVLLRGDSKRALALPATGSKTWHRARITLRGNQVSMTVDGAATATDRLLEGIASAGRIGLRPAGRAMQWANVFVRRQD